MGPLLGHVEEGVRRVLPRYPVAFVALFVAIFLIIATFLYDSLAFTAP